MSGVSRKWGPEIEHLDKGLVRYALGKREEAIESWRKALELNPKSRRAVDFLQSVGALPAGDPDASAVTGQNPAVSVSELGGGSLLDRSGESLVPPFTGSVSSLDPDLKGGDASVVSDVDLLMNSAATEQAAGKPEKALGRCEEVLRRDPDHPAALTLSKQLRDELIAVYSKELEPMARVPKVRATDDALLELSTDPIGALLIGEINGEISVRELLVKLGNEDDFKVLSALHFFLAKGIIELA